MSSEPMEAPIIELSTPDGNTFQCRYCATLPYQGRDYLVLSELEPDPKGEEQLLIMAIDRQSDEEALIETVKDPAIVQAVFQKYCEMSADLASGKLPYEQ